MDQSRAVSGCVVVSIGCLECRSSSELLGAYDTIEAAHADYPEARLRDDVDEADDWCGDAVTVIFPLPDR